MWPDWRFSNKLWNKSWWHFGNVNFEEDLWLLFGQLLEKIRQLFLTSSGHTGSHPTFLHPRGPTVTRAKVLSRSLSLSLSLKVSVPNELFQLGTYVWGQENISNCDSSWKVHNISCLLLWITHPRLRHSMHELWKGSLTRLSNKSIPILFL